MVFDKIQAKMRAYKAKARGKQIKQLQNKVRMEKGEAYQREKIAELKAEVEKQKMRGRMEQKKKTSNTRKNVDKFFKNAGNVSLMGEPMKTKKTKKPKTLFGM